MINKFKININNIKKGGAQAAYNTSSPVDADLSTGSLKDPLKTNLIILMVVLLLLLVVIKEMEVKMT